MEQMTSDLEDEAVSGSEMDKRLADLRKEVRKSSASFTGQCLLSFILSLFFLIKAIHCTRF